MHSRFGYLSGSASHKGHQEMIILISEPITAALKTHSSRRNKLCELSPHPPFRRGQRSTRTTRSLRVTFSKGEHIPLPRKLHPNIADVPNVLCGRIHASAPPFKILTSPNDHPRSFNDLYHPSPQKERYRKPLTKHLGSHQFSQIIIREN